MNLLPLYVKHGGGGGGGSGGGERRAINESGTSILRMRREGVRVTIMKRARRGSCNAGPDCGRFYPFLKFLF